MKKTSLHGAIAALLGISAMAGYSSQASAFGSTNLGTFTGTTLSLNTTTPFRAFADYEAGKGALGYNQGWIHTAKFLRLTVGTAADIASGATFDVQLTMTGRGPLTATGAINNPSFAVWTAGQGSINTGDASGVGHGWNPTRGYGETATDINGDTTTTLTNYFFVAAGVLPGHDGWVGYVNSGPSYTIGQNLDPLGNQPQTANGVPVLDPVAHGGLNTSSPWLTNPGASSTGYTDNFYRDGYNGPMVGSTYDYAMMTLYGLKAGNYLIGTGGSCPDQLHETFAGACGLGNQFTFTVSTAAPVPLPGAVWLFGSALAGLIGLKRRG